MATAIVNYHAALVCMQTKCNDKTDKMQMEHFTQLAVLHKHY